MFESTQLSRSNICLSAATRRLTACLYCSCFCYGNTYTSTLLVCRLLMKSNWSHKYYYLSTKRVMDSTCFSFYKLELCLKLIRASLPTYLGIYQCLRHSTSTTNYFLICKHEILDNMKQRFFLGGGGHVFIFLNLQNMISTYAKDFCLENCPNLSNPSTFTSVSAKIG